MPIHKKRFGNGFKAKVALSALKGDKTFAELKNSCSPNPHQQMEKETVRASAGVILL